MKPTRSTLYSSDKMNTRNQILTRQNLPAEILRSNVWLLITAASLLLGAPRATAQTYAIDWFTVDAGGGTCSGNVYQLSGTIGQPDAGSTMNGGTCNLDGGFWGIAAVVQRSGAPALTMRRTSPTTAMISWPYPSTGFTLEETSNLGGSSWVTHSGNISNDGAMNNVVVNTSLGNRFFRLKKAASNQVQPTKLNTMNQ